MLKLIPQYKQGNKSPDHDPTHPYHYHTSDGKKVVVTPEDWEKYKDDPTFREVRAAIEAEQAAYPLPEYSDKYNNYINNLANEIENQRGYNGGTNNSLISESYGKQLPQGYSRTERGLIIGPDGRPLVASKFKNSPKYTADFNNATLLTFNKGLGTERNINYYPINVNVPIYKQPLPVDRVMNVGEESNKVIQQYINNNTRKVNSGNKSTPVTLYQVGKRYKNTNVVADNGRFLDRVIKGANNVVSGNQSIKEALEPNQYVNVDKNVSYEDIYDDNEYYAGNYQDVENKVNNFVTYHYGNKYDNDYKTRSKMFGSITDTSKAHEFEKFVISPEHSITLNAPFDLEKLRNDDPSSYERFLNWVDPYTTFDEPWFNDWWGKYRTGYSQTVKPTIKEAKNKAVISVNKLGGKVKLIKRTFSQYNL